MTEDITKGKSKKKIKARMRILEQLHEAGHNQATPQHDAADAAVAYQQEMARPDCDKATGNPVANVHSETGSYNDSRLSEPIAAGHAAYSPEDHGVGQGRNSAIAAGHESLRQSNTSFEQVLTTLRTQRGDRTTAEIGLAGFAYAGEVSPRFFDAAGAAGHYAGMNPVNPSPLRPADHQSQGSATPPNSGFPALGAQQASCTVPRPSMKAVSPEMIRKASGQG